ncbi:MAG: hypothetical protein HQ564_02270 [Candidatus Saganbacteria bacterium]|nr:hypothetical protein [Candidatus Saganbacteria bacterium]
MNIFSVRPRVFYSASQASGVGRQDIGTRKIDKIQDKINQILLERMLDFVVNPKLVSIAGDNGKYTGTELFCPMRIVNLRIDLTREYKEVSVKVEPLPGQEADEIAERSLALFNKLFKSEGKLVPTQDRSITYSWQGVNWDGILGQ